VTPEALAAVALLAVEDEDPLTEVKRERLRARLVARFAATPDRPTLPDLSDHDPEMAWSRDEIPTLIQEK
jgi:hypothetical protein